MAREYGKLYIRAWSDKDFITLPARAQRTYMFLMSQPDLSNAGTITLALKRWANCVGDENSTQIEDDLRLLADKRYVIVDSQCEELLIRSFIKWDEGWRSPNMMVSIKAAAQQALSETIRAVLRDEVGKLDTSTLPTKVSAKTGRSTKEFVELVIGQLVESLQNDEVDPDVIGWGDGFSQPQIEIDERVSERVKTTKINPLPNPSRKGFLTSRVTTAIDTTDTTTTAIDTTRKNAAVLDPEFVQYTNDFEEFWKLYPRKEDKKAAFKAFKSALRRSSFAKIYAGVQSYATDPNLPELKYIKHAATWLNGDCWLNGRLPARAPTAVTSTQKARAEWDEDRRILAQLESEERGGRTGHVIES